jgi:hypothetical protein
VENVSLHCSPISEKAMFLMFPGFARLSFWQEYQNYSTLPIRIRLVPHRERSVFPLEKSNSECRMRKSRRFIVRNVWNTQRTAWTKYRAFVVKPGRTLLTISLIITVCSARFNTNKSSFCLHSVSMCLV